MKNRPESPNPDRGAAGLGDIPCPGPGTRWLLTCYLYFASLLFLTAATFKLLSDFSAPSLTQPDPFFRIPTGGQLLLLVAGLQIGVAIFVLIHVRNKPGSALRAVLWLASLFLIYRLGFAFAPAGGTCKCFGAGSLLGKMEPLADLLSGGALCLLIGGGTVLLVLTRHSCINTPIRGGRSSRNTVNVLLTAILLACSDGLVLAEDLMFTPSYTARGVVIMERLSQEHVFKVAKRFPFEISADQRGRWQIHWEMSFPQWGSTSREYISCDGTNVFSVVYADKVLDENYHPVPNTAKSFPARICRGPFPTDHSNVAGLVWLVFLGGNYVTAHPESKIPNLLEPSARTNPLAWVCELDYTFLSTSLTPLLKAGTFRVNPKRLSQDLMDFPEVEEPSSPEELQAIQSQMKSLSHIDNPENLVRASFRIEEVIHAHSLTIPKRFTGLYYSPNFIPNATHRAVNRWRGQVTNWIQHPGPTRLLPPLDGETFTVQDRRFMFRRKDVQSRGRRYELRDKSWPITTNDSRLRASEGPGPQPRMSAHGREWAYYFFVTTCILVLTVPLFISLWKRFHGRNE